MSGIMLKLLGVVFIVGVLSLHPILPVGFAALLAYIAVRAYRDDARMGRRWTKSDLAEAIPITSLVAISEILAVLQVVR